VWLNSVYNNVTSDVGKSRREVVSSVFLTLSAAFGEAGSKTRLMNILVQLRKCVNHPYLFDGVEPEPFELGEHLVEAVVSAPSQFRPRPYLHSKESCF